MNIFKDAVEHFSHDWCNRRGLFFMEMYSSMVPIIGAILIATLQQNAPFLYLYIFFITGSFVGVIVGNIRKSGWWVLMSIMFACINCLGIYNAIYG